MKPVRIPGFLSLKLLQYFPKMPGSVKSEAKRPCYHDIAVSQDRRPCSSIMTLSCGSGCRCPVHFILERSADICTASFLRLCHASVSQDCKRCPQCRRLSSIKRKPSGECAGGGLVGSVPPCVRRGRICISARPLAYALRCSEIRRTRVGPTGKQINAQASGKAGKSLLLQGECEAAAGGASLTPAPEREERNDKGTNLTAKT